jgi:preprotein translocase subunit SecE
LQVRVLSALQVVQELSNEEEGMSMAEELEQVSEDVVEKAKADKASSRNFIARIVLFFKQVVIELKKVTKPTWAELRNYTGVVLAFVVVVMAIISLFDWLFYQGVVFIFTPTA